MKLQRQLSNGSWIDDDRTEYFFDFVLEREQWYAPRVNRQPMTTHHELTDYLATGKTIHYDSDWYANIRDGEAHARLLELAKQRRDNDPNFSNTGWELDCGHVVHHRSHIMSSSQGSSCTDCYDRMSN